MVLPNHNERGPFFSKNDFVYDAESDTYTCPQGETLRRQGRDYKERSARYAARPYACNACPLRARCTKSKKKGRWIRRSFDEEYLQKVRSYGDTEAYRKALRKRQVWVEPLFAEALLIAAGQNIKRLLTYAYRGPRREAQVIALRHPTSKPYEFCSVRKHLKRCAWRPPRVFQHPEVFSETPLLDENTKA